jgi:macrolide transport system ATP-binding/permease protein
MLLQDVRYALRGWRGHPLLISAAILSLALGMGANTAVFSVLNAALLTTAPVAEPAALILVYSTSAANPSLQGTSFPNYEDLRRALPFELAAAAPISIGLSTENGEPEELPAELVSDNYFDVVGVRAGHGRVFATGQGTTPGSNPIVVVSDTLWQRRFNRRPDAIGQKVSINGRPFTIAGIAPRGFASLDVMRAVDVWIPTVMHQDALTGVQGFYFRQRSGGMFDVVARRPPSLTASQMLAMLGAQARLLTDAYPKENTGLNFEVRPLTQAGPKPAQRAVWLRAGGLIAAIVALVLLIACVNVANLLLARSAARHREIAVRTAIGASKRQLIRQLLIESVMLSAAGAVLGVGIADVSLRVLKAVRPVIVPESFDASLDLRVFAFTAIVAAATGLGFGLIPALQTARQDIVSGLKEGRVIGGRASRFSRALLVVQSTLATVALVLAALFVRSVQQAQAVDPGFNRTNLAVVSFDLGMLRYDNTQGQEFVRRVNERMASIPGVITSAVSSYVVLDGAPLASKIRLVGQPEAEALAIRAQAVGQEYFRAMDIPLLEGRTFRPTDTVTSAFGWAIVNQTMANQLWPGRTVIGQRFEILGPGEYEIIGLVADSQYETLAEAPQPFFYIFYDQAPGLKKLTLFVRTIGDPRALLSTIERDVRSVDPNLPLLSIRTISDVMNRATWVPRTGSALLTMFAVISLVLAAIGTYGVTAFFVRQQWREIGIRAAIGATGREIVFYLIKWTLMPGLIGLALGMLVARLSGRAIAGLLIDVSPGDPISFVVPAIILVLVSGAAAAIPAWGAMRMDLARVLTRD